VQPKHFGADEVDMDSGSALLPALYRSCLRDRGTIPGGDAEHPDRLTLSREVRQALLVWDLV
jgi:hypothetical protein